MAKEELLEFEGTVTEVLPNGNFRVKLDNDHTILAYAAGRMKRHRIRTLQGDRVTVEMSPYDLERGRISFRHKSETPVPAAPTRAFRHPAIALCRRRSSFCIRRFLRKAHAPLPHPYLRRAPRVRHRRGGTAFRLVPSHPRPWRAPVH